jgi:hypothetical protein
VNPSYYAPYAYRYFARHDPSHDWRQLVDTSYFLLERNAVLTTTHLPSDWLLLDTATGALSLGSERDSQYAYDAFRAHWRVRLDGVLFGEERSRAYLAGSLAWLAERYRQDGRLPAIIFRDGRAGADYEALEMLAGVSSALQESAPDVGESMNVRLQRMLSEGFWGDRESYYLQNWAWFGSALQRRQLSPFERLRLLRVRRSGRATQQPVRAIVPEDEAKSQPQQATCRGEDQRQGEPVCAQPGLEACGIGDLGDATGLCDAEHERPLCRQEGHVSREGLQHSRLAEAAGRYPQQRGRRGPKSEHVVPVCARRLELLDERQPAE